MAIEIREPPVLTKTPELSELSLWLHELREKLVAQIDNLIALTTHIATKPTSIYWGSGEGAWRIIRSGDDLLFQRRESGAWVEKFRGQAK